MLRGTTDTSAGEPSGSGNESSRRGKARMRTNVTRACGACRLKRTRCDGLPRCSTCETHDRECVYERESDGRRPPRKQYVEALERRVKDLENRMSREGDKESSDADVATAPGSSINPMLSPTLSTTATSRIFGQGVSHYGPTSAYAHMPDETDSPILDQDDPQFGRAFTIAEMDWSLFAWDKPLPAGIIQNAEVHKTLLSIFFSYICDWNNWCDESGFLAGLYANAMAERTVRNRHYSPFLHNVILSVACLLSTDDLFPVDQNRHAATAFAETAQQMISEEAKKPMTTTVRGLMLLGTFHFQNTQRNLGWLYEGMGARTAQILGLNTDCDHLVSRGVMSQKAKMHRDATFYTVYTQDILWAFNVGRSPYFHRDDYQTPLPTINSDEDAIPWWDHRDRLVAQTLPGRPAWRSTAFHYTARLAQIGSEVHRAWYRVVQRSPTASLGYRSKLQLDLGEWLIDLPNAIRLEAWNGSTTPPHIINLHLMYDYMRMLLHRPVCFQNAGVEEDERRDAQRICEEAALEVLRLSDLSTDIYFSTQTVINIFFTAGTTFLLLSTRPMTEPGAIDAATALDNLDKCGRTLQTMAWPSAKVLFGILKRMKQEWHPPAPAPTVATSVSRPSMQELQDPNSEMFQYLTRMGWAPPAVNSQAPQPTPTTQGLAGIDPSSDLAQLLGQGVDDSAFDPFAAWPWTVGEFNTQVNQQFDPAWLTFE